MTGSSMSRRGALVGLAALVAAVTGSPVAAAGQEVRIEVTVPREVVSAIEDAIRLVQRDVIREVRSALRDAAHEVDAVLGALGQPPRQNRNWRGRFQSTEERRVDVRAGGTLVLRNVAGPVTVAAGRGRSVDMRFVHVGMAATDARARAALERSPIRVTERGDRVVVEGTGAPDRTASVMSTFTIAVPPGTNVAIESVAGAVSVTGIDGRVTIETAAGAVTVRDTPRLASVETMAGAVDIRGVRHENGLEVTTLNGTVTLDGIAVRRLDVETVAGSITASDIAATTADVGSTAGQVTFRGELARGGRYEFHSHNGALDLLFWGAGFTLDASSFGGDIRPEGFELRSPSRSRRSLTGIAGDGSATVEAVTFNGAIIIRRRP